MSQFRWRAFAEWGHVRRFHSKASAQKQDSESKHLAIALMNGMLQLMNSQLDRNPIIIDTMVKVAYIAWNPIGTILIVAGTMEVTEMEQAMNVVRFYSSAGALLHQMRIPRSKNLEGAQLLPLRSFLLCVTAENMTQAKKTRCYRVCYRSTGQVGNR